MHTRFLFLLFILFASFTAKAQDLLYKIPADAVAVLKIKTGQLSSLLPADEFSKTETGKKLLQTISQNKNIEVKNVADFGIHLSASSYYFRLFTDSISYNCILLPINDVSKFNKMILTEQENSSTRNTWTKVSSDSAYFMMWNKEYAVIASGTLSASFFYQTEAAERYGISNPYDYTSSAATDSSAVVEDVIDTIPLPQADTIIAPPSAIYEDSAYTYNDSSYSDKYSELYKKDQQIKNTLTAKWTEAALKELFNKQPALSIASNADYMKQADENAAVVFWVKDPIGMYSSSIPYYKYPLSSYTPNNLLGMGLHNSYGYKRFAANVYTDEKAMRITTNLEMDEDYAGVFNKVYKRKLNKNFFKYMNADSLMGYMTYSLDTKTYLEEFPKLLQKTLAYPGIGVREEEVSLAGEFISLLLDEEAISKMIKGDGVFLFNGITEHEYTYTDYEYDENYNSKEIKKTKKESIPDFVMMFSSEENELIKKLISYGIKKETVKSQGLFYELIIPGNPSRLFFMQKDGIFFFSNSLTDMQKIAGNSYPANFSKKQIKEIQKANFTMLMNPQKISNKLSSSGMEITETFTTLINSLSNMGKVIAKSLPVNGNSLMGEMTMEVPPGNENSLTYLVTLIDRFIK